MQDKTPFEKLRVADRGREEGHAADDEQKRKAPCQQKTADGEDQCTTSQAVVNCQRLACRTGTGGFFAKQPLWFPDCDRTGESGFSEHCVHAGNESASCRADPL